MKHFLSDSERDSLMDIHRTEKNVRTKERLKVILLRDEGATFTAIGKYLYIDRETASTYVYEYLEHGKTSIQSGGSKSRLNEKQTEELLEHLTEKTYPTVSHICKYVKETYDLEYSVSGMTFWLKKNNFTYKKPRPTPVKADILKQNQFIKTYKEIILNAKKKTNLSCFLMVFIQLWQQN